RRDSRTLNTRRDRYSPEGDRDSSESVVQTNSDTIAGKGNACNHAHGRVADLCVTRSLLGGTPGGYPFPICVLRKGLEGQNCKCGCCRKPQNHGLSSNECRQFPSSAEEGWLRGKRKSCEATLARADGVVLVSKLIS